MVRHSIPKILLLLLPIVLLIVSPVIKVDAQAIAPITINQLLYATIPNFAIEGSPMATLNDGKLATNYNAPQYYYINLDTDSSSYTTGDFLNTGVSDIAATIMFNGGGSGTFYYLLVFVNNNGTPQYLTATELGDRITVNKISYDNSVFSVDIITQGPNDPMCCGTLHEVLQYQLQNGSLVAVNNSSNTPVAPTPSNYQNPISSSSASSSSTDSTQWFILGGLIIFVLFVIGLALVRRKRTRRITEGRNPNTANAIYLIIIGMACFFAENEFLILLGFVIMFFAWRLYVKGKPKLKAKTAGQKQRRNSSESENSSNQNQAQEPPKKRRHPDDPEMKALYRRLMHKYHPDRGRNKGDDKFRNDLTVKINKAYQEGDFETLKLFE